MTMEIEDVARAAQLASALEVCGYPKPGNVHRTADLKEVNFEEFVASSIAIGPALLEVAKKGFEAGEGKIDLSSIGIGNAIKRAIQDTMAWQMDENTNFGTVMLLVPLTAAASFSLVKEGKVGIKKLRGNLSRILKSTTPQDALDVYDAISIAKPGGLGKVDELDVKEEGSKKKIIEEKISIYEIMRISSPWDTISSEWVTDMRITFELGYPLLKKIYQKTKNLNSTTVQTFLEILSRYPDSLVQRTHGRGVAEEVSRKARAVLEKGGILKPEGKKIVERFDKGLRRKRINPGTSADLTASSLMLAILDGLRP